MEIIMKTIGVIGGDLRQIALADDFKKDGYSVYTYGLTGLDCPDNNYAFNADVIILPIPVSSSDTLNMPFSESKLKLSDALDKIKEGSVVFGGKFSKWARSFLKAKGVLCFDITEREEFPVYNAVPTAEGAIDIAIAETAFTISESSILITGFGNISKSLARVLHSMNANVDLAMRNKKQAAEAECLGYTVFPINDILNHIHKYDIIFNTVPALIFTSPVLEASARDVLIIDLASKPGGVDFTAAGLMPRKVIWALSLPGKTAPLTAGKIIKKTITNILYEMEGNKNA